MAQRAWSKNAAPSDTFAFTKNPDKAALLYQRSKNAPIAFGWTKNPNAGLGIVVTTSKNN